MVVHKPDTVKNERTAGRKRPEWVQKLSEFQTPDTRKVLWQLMNTLLPYCFLWYLMARSIQLGYSYAVTLALCLPAAGLLVRIFILFHDCVHGSFFKSRRANIFFGYLLGTLAFTSFEDWRFTHLRHHGTFGNLDNRGTGDIWTLTLDEYEKESWAKRLQYRLYRNLGVLIGLGAVFSFLFANRFPTWGVGKKEQKSIIVTNILIACVILFVAWLIGWKTYLLIQIPVSWFSGMAGIWLFYVQHQFPGGYWARKEEWDPFPAAMEGSSFYKLPPILGWFSGSIGYHHIHHLSPKIPNYNLKPCFDAVPELHIKTPLTLMKSLGCARLKLWDEAQQKMVPLP